MLVINNASVPGNWQYNYSSPHSHFTWFDLSFDGDQCSDESDDFAEVGPVGLTLLTGKNRQAEEGLTGAWRISATTRRN